MFVFDFFFQTRMQSLTASTGQSISGTLIRMVKNEGLLRPVRGLSAMVVGAGPSHALYFSSYEYLKDTMIQHTNTTRYHTAIYGRYLNFYLNNAKYRHYVTLSC